MKKIYLVFVSCIYLYIDQIQAAAGLRTGLQQAAKNSAPNLRKFSSNSQSVNQAIVPYQLNPQSLPANTPWYEVLNVSEHATQAEINAAYKKLAQQYHPDKFTNLADKAKPQETFKAINNAKEQTKQQENFHDAGSSNQPAINLDPIIYAISIPLIGTAIGQEVNPYINAWVEESIIETSSTNNATNLIAQEEISNDQSKKVSEFIDAPTTSPNIEHNLVEQPASWSDYLTSTSRSFANSITDTTSAGIQLASDNPITTAAIVSGIAIAGGTAAYYWYQNNYRKKPDNQAKTEQPN